MYRVVCLTAGQTCPPADIDSSACQCQSRRRWPCCDGHWWSLWRTLMVTVTVRRHRRAAAAAMIVPSANWVIPILCANKVQYVPVQIIAQNFGKSIAQKYCTKLVTKVLFIFIALHFAHNCVKLLLFILHSIVLPIIESLFVHIALFAHIAHIGLSFQLSDKSNICTLVHRFVHNKVDQFCCSLILRPLAAACLLLIAALFTMLCVHAVTHWSHIQINNRTELL